ncbi:hypothetical protein JCM8115_006660 [Rhodotorula mucilaginosa]|uniref:Respiratory supercomplex factor 1, mitochondrial n=1 Tax=Rhodotorula mucilaginosa TaxID=5537 RepID=A0A9P7BAH2_RHOMI|nr:Respiratory supercomplex factor 1, mitochondrial [Rhodotorula mucilaginosa]
MPAAYTPDPIVSAEDMQAINPPPQDPTTWAKFSRKFKEEPLVPIGCLATVAALLGASSALQKGNRTQFNMFLRYRVAAQGLTLIAALGGSVYYGAQRRAQREADRAAKAAAAAASASPTLA